MSDEWKLAGEGPIHRDDLPTIAEELIQQSGAHTIWLIKGEMGAGKTTLVKHIVDKLGVSAPVASPTFSIVNQYGNEDGKLVYHFDLYRLKNELEAFDIGLDEYFYSGNICMIEWPEKLEKLLPDQYFEIEIKPCDSLGRKIYYRHHD